MEHHDPLDHLGRMLMASYVLISKTLGWLPIPIGLPPIDGEWDGTIADDAIDAARISLRYLPLDETTQSLLVRLLLEWLTGRALWEAAAAQEAPPTAWQYEAIAYTLTRITSLHQVVEPRLRSDQD
ncbi:hypothetical protein ACFYY8_31480 [Streptosporangium sp. NPDC001559]|uniref:hypothetical protein n=1 Tax=Streptosporangium sp. NPDC001559 TaxID=3366187 RepID=UPI0036E52DA4